MKSKTRIRTMVSAATLPLVAIASIGLVGSARALESQAADSTASAAAPVANDLLRAGRTIQVQRRIPGDVAAVGRDVTIEAPVQGYVMSAGRTVTLAGSIGNDLWAAGEVVDVAGDVGNNRSRPGAACICRPARWSATTPWSLATR